MVLNRKRTFAAIQTIHKPSNIYKYDNIKKITWLLFTIFDDFNFETRFNSLHFIHIKGR